MFDLFRVLRSPAFLDLMIPFTEDRSRSTKKVYGNGKEIEDEEQSVSWQKRCSCNLTSVSVVEYSYSHSSSSLETVAIPDTLVGELFDTGRVGWQNNTRGA